MTVNEQPALYVIKAFWPNSTVKPVTKYKAHYADALDLVIGMVQQGAYCTISVTIEDLEVFRFWGMVEGLP